MELIKTIVMGAGLLLMWNGYQEGKDPAPITPVVPAPVVPTPDNPTPVTPVVPLPPGTTVKVVVDPPEQLAPAPNPAYVASMAPFAVALQGHPEDALRLARAYAAWAELIATDSTLRTTEEFKTAYTSAMQVLFTKHALDGKYPYKLAQDPMIAVFTANGLADGTSVFSQAWTPAAAKAAAEGFNLISHECFKAYTSQLK